MDPWASILQPGVLFEGRYDVLGELGAGSFGRVYKARQLSTGQEVAIKLLRVREHDSPREFENQRERFRREMRLCATLSHPHIVRLIDSGETGGDRLYAVFEFVPGTTLRELLEMEGRLELPEALHLLTQVLDALSCAHAQGIVHRDLKPENIMVARTGVRRNAMVLDFGLGGFSASAFEAARTRLTATREMMGTPSYAAPEQLRGEAPSPRSDLYSWGLILLECLTGEMAVSGKTGYEVLLKQLGPEPIPVPGWLRQHRLGRLLAAVTSKDAAARDLDIASVLEALDGIQRSAATGVDGEQRQEATEGEHRQLTLMMATAQAIRRDDGPVDLDDLDVVMRQYRALCERVVTQAGGMVVDARPGVMQVAFGYPRAGEKDARRATRAALRVLAETAAANVTLERERGVRVQVRIGLHSGVGIVRAQRPAGGGDPRFEIVGAPPVMAMRVAERAGSDQVAVTLDTHALLRDEIECQRAGEIDVPGRSARLPIFLAVRDRPAASLETFSRRHETPLVGRAGELAQLLGLWVRAEAGESAVALVQGEPGIGKSRLVRELRRQVPRASLIECRCTPEGQGSPFHPIVDWLRSLPDPIDQLLQRHGFDVAETLPLFLDLLAIPADEHAPALRLSPERHKELTLAAVVALIVRLARARPLVFVLEDLHWADPTTLEMVCALVEEVRAAQVARASAHGGLLAVFTTRPEYAPPWLSGDISVLSVGRLSRQEVASMVRGGLPSDHRLSTDVVERIVERTDGVPLFVEELVHVLATEDAGPAAEAVPGTLRELLSARLDALSTSAHETVQVASAVGREFRYDLLRLAVEKDDWAVRQDLLELIDARLVYGHRRASDEGYVFKHALVRDAAYESLVRASRERVHHRIAAAIREHLPALADQQPELLAHHLERGGDADAAVAFWQKAGDRDFRRAAYPEATRHLEHALATSAGLVATPASAQREIDLLIALGTVHLATRGHADPQVQEAFSRARGLCEQQGVEVSLKIVAALASIYIMRGDREAIEAFLPRCQRFASEARDPVTILTGLLPLAVYAFFRGRHGEAEQLLARGRLLYRTEDFRRYAEEYGWDGGIYTYAYSVWNLAVAGERARSTALLNELLALSDASFDPQAIPLTLAFGMAAAHALDDPDAARGRAERLVAIAGEQHMYLLWSIGLCGQGWALARGGETGQGVETIRQGLELMRMSGARTVYGYYLTYWIEGLMLAGRLAEARASVEEGLGICATDLACVHEPELLRLQGELLARGGDERAARDVLEHARTIAQDRRAGAWERRITRRIAELASVLQRDH
jgi:TOMM system kinase/cyclase fusion protein